MLHVRLHPSSTQSQHPSITAVDDPHSLFGTKAGLMPHGCRAGLYKQLAELKSLLAEFREAPARNTALRKPIIQTLNASGQAPAQSFQKGAQMASACQQRSPMSEAAACLSGQYLVLWTEEPELWQCCASQ